MYVCLSVCLPVCLSVRLLVIQLHFFVMRYIDILYMDRSGIYRGWFLSIFRDHITDRPDAIGRNPDAIGKCSEKSAFFPAVLIKFSVLGMRYELHILNEDKEVRLTHLQRFLKKLVYSKLVNYTGEAQKSRQKYQKWCYFECKYLSQN